MIPNWIVETGHWLLPGVDPIVIALLFSVSVIAWMFELVKLNKEI